MKNVSRLLAALVFALLTLAPALHAAPTAAHGTIRVKITYVEMKRADVEKLSVITAPVTARHDDLAAVLNAARRAHVSFVSARGPILTASTGTTVSKGDVDVHPYSVRNGRAQVLIHVARRAANHRGHSVTHVVASSYLYRSGATRRLAGVRQANGRYRYTFATVTVL